MRIGIGRMAREIDGFVEWAQLVDRAGFAFRGFGDSQSRWMDCWTMLGIAAANTERVMLGPFITNPIGRHPAVAAGAAVTLQKISHGRVMFGLGTGETSIHDLQEPKLPLSDFAEYALAVKGLAAGETAAYRGRELKLLWHDKPVRMFIAGDGAEVQRLAGRIGDGAIVGNGATPEVVRYALANIRAGALEAGRDPDEIEVWFMTRVQVAKSQDDVFRDMRTYMATYANTRYRSGVGAKGIPVDEDTAERLRGLRRDFRYEDSLFTERTYNADLVDKYGLREWLGRQFVVAGPREQCIERLRELEAAGARNILVPMVMGDVLQSTRAIAEQILPAFL
jgi:5,10-methylenetetrahydromethanopterin reductase